MDFPIYKGIVIKSGFQRILRGKWLIEISDL